MKFRFSLRTLLIVVALAAAASWAYWIGWPSWLVYREQCQFEATFKQLHVGSTTDDMLALRLSRAREVANVLPFTYPDCDWFVRGWPNAVYVAVFLGESSIKRGRVPSKSVALYRLSPIPKDYQPLSASIRNAWPGWTAEYLAKLKAEQVRSIYAQDFLYFIIEDPKHNPGFKYELIYSDPPAKPGASLQELKPADTSQTSAK